MEDEAPEKGVSPDTGYDLSQVADGLWTVEGAYSAPFIPADYFRSSKLYEKILTRPSSRRPVTRRPGKRLPRALEPGRTRLRRKSPPVR